MPMLRLAHIVNPVFAAQGSVLQWVQPISFESIVQSKKFCEQDVAVNLLAVGFDEDASAAYPGFTWLPTLQQSVLNFYSFTEKRQLPLIADILNAALNNCDEEYIVYTNADIALMPQFYSVVAYYLQSGADAVVINRRGIDTSFNTVSQLPLMYSAFGKPHPGYDCFVLKCSVIEKMQLGKICVGIPFLEVCLAHNVVAFAQNPVWIDHLHLTFHIGTEVMPPIAEEYYRYNRNEYEQNIYPLLQPQLQLQKFPYGLLPFHKRMIKWMLNPVFRTRQMAELEGKSFSRRLKHRIDTVRFALLERIK